MRSLFTTYFAMQLVVFMRRILRRHAVFIPLGDASIYGISGIGTGWAFFIRSLVQ